jgi:transcriptional regulator with XRE-family HTH domain
MTVHFETLAENIRKWIIKVRTDRSISQSGLAKLSSMSMGHMNRIEKGDTSNLSIRTLVRIANSLDHDVRIEFVKRRKNDDDENETPSAIMHYSALLCLIELVTVASHIL